MRLVILAFFLLLLFLFLQAAELEQLRRVTLQLSFENQQVSSPQGAGGKLGNRI